MEKQEVIIISAPNIPEDKLNNLILAIRQGKIEIPMYITTVPLKPITKEDIMKLHEHLDYIIKENNWRSPV